jgi:hypothetical protein
MLWMGGSFRHLLHICIIYRISTLLFDFTGMAQRQRAGLITPRTLDRNGLPVFIYVY